MEGIVYGTEVAVCIEDWVELIRNTLIHHVGVDVSARHVSKVISVIAPFRLDTTPANAMHVLRSSLAAKLVGPTLALQVGRRILAEVSELRATLGGTPAEFFPTPPKSFASRVTMQLYNHKCWIGKGIAAHQQTSSACIKVVFPTYLLPENLRLTDKNERPVLMVILADLMTGLHNDVLIGKVIFPFRKFVRSICKNAEYFANSILLLRIELFGRNI
jgi:hypothetical protein